jgi:hypothetical protein
LNFAHIYATEAGLTGSEIVPFALRLHKLVSENAAVSTINQYVEGFYKDYDPRTDSRILTALLKLYNQHVDKTWMPGEVTQSDVEGYVAQLFEKSILTDAESLKDFIHSLNAKSVKKLENDPAYLLASSISDFYTVSVRPELERINKEIADLNRLWLAGLMEMQPDKVFYADANSTLRVAYGEVGGYEPVDAVRYTHYTTLKGIMEKDNPAIYDYNIPQKLRDIYKAKDFGSYTQDGEVPVCFIANNHTTGGNSGSPVLNADGHLIGINFDRAWEGVMSDLLYAPEICKNISVDIRYVLFIMDKLAGAKHLIDEMTIVEE